MIVHQCDNCKNIIKKGEQVIVGRDTICTYVELCPECAKPVVLSVRGAALRPALKEKIKEKSQYDDF